jgi:hypothetical protein
MKRILQLAALAAFGTSLCGAAHAAPPEKRSAGLRDSLNRVSELLFIGKQDEFIVVDALKDGYLEFDERFELGYNSGGVTINGKRLPEDVSERYLQRLRDFRLRDDMTPESRYSAVISGAGYSKSALLDPASDFRRHRTPAADPKKIDNAKSGNRILNELLRDGIVSDAANFAIRYDSTGLKVNNAMLSPAMDEKYRMLYRVMMDIDPKAGTKGYSYSISTEINGAKR